ncbi:MAG: hypothetical protein WC045_03920 [Patescibacteria group bacterium]
MLEQKEMYVDQYLRENGRLLEERPATGQAFELNGAYYWTCYLLTVKIPQGEHKKRIFLHIGAFLPFDWRPVDEYDVPGLIDFLNMYYRKS